MEPAFAHGRAVDFVKPSHPRVFVFVARVPVSGHPFLCELQARTIIAGEESTSSQFSLGSEWAVSFPTEVECAVNQIDKLSAAIPSLAPNNARSQDKLPFTLLWKVFGAGNWQDRKNPVSPVPFITTRSQWKKAGAGPDVSTLRPVRSSLVSSGSGIACSVGNESFFRTT